jgi:hypothetical protein
MAVLARECHGCGVPITSFSLGLVAMRNVAHGPKRHFAATQQSLAFGGILLQKSKVAGLRIFRENTKREATADSYNLNRVAEVAGGFDVRRRGPSHLYTKAAPVARRIFDHQCKTTFATVSGGKRTATETTSRQGRGRYWCGSTAVLSMRSITISRTPEASSGHQRPLLNARQTPNSSPGCTKCPMADRKQRQAQHGSFLFAGAYMRAVTVSAGEGPPGGELCV